MESLFFVTWFDTLESDGLLAVLDHGVHVPGGESGHRGVVDFQEEVIPRRRSAGEKLADHRELSVLRAAPQLRRPRLALLAAAEDALADSVGPVVLLLLQALGHGSELGWRGGKKEGRVGRGVC